MATENASASSASSSDNLGVEKPAGGTAEEAVELAATIEEAMAHGEPNVAAAAAQVAVPANLYPTGPAASEEAMVGVDNAFEEDAKMAAAIAPKKLTPERKEKLDALGFVWSLRTKRIEDHWDEMFRQLCEYRDKHGDCLVPSRYDVNPKLGKWVETQRYEYTKMQRAANGVTVEAKVEEAEDAGAKQRPAIPNPRLTEERLRRLESIGFQFKVKHKMKRYYDKQWDQMFERLLKFRDENGHCMVPKRYAADVKLGTWVHTQRIQYRKMISSKGAASDGGGSVDGTKAMDTMSDAGSEDMVLEKTGSEEEISFRLTDERRKRLEEIGFCWSAREGDKVSTDPSKVTRNSYDDQWDYMFNRLKLYKDTYGNCLVPKRFKDDPKLGTWVDTQRVQYKKMQKKLASQGVQYDGPAVDSGDEGSQPASSSQEKPIVGRLTDERIRRLESLGFVWSLRDDWWKHYEELKAFKEQHGHCNVPARYAQNRRLGIWVSAQRQQYKLVNSALDDPKQRRAAPLTAERVGLLNELGFTWTIRSRDSLGESWNQRLQDLVDFRKAHGHCNVPSRYPPCPELGVWVGTQRTQYRFYMKAKETGEKAPGNSAMNEERIKQLEDLGFNWSLRGGSEGARREAETSMNDSAARIQELVDDDFPSEMV